MQVSIRMLRYYDETGLLKPAEVDYFTNYRLYSTDQIPVLNKIVFLRDLGFNVSQITRALDSWNEKSVSMMLEEKYIDIEKGIKSEQEKLHKIEQVKKDMIQGRMDINYNVSVKNIPAYQVLALRRIVPNYFSEGKLWDEMTDYVEKNNITVSEKTFTIYHDTEYREQDVDIEICVHTEWMGKNENGFVFRITEAIPNMACTMINGDFGKIAGAYRAFAGWLQDHSQYKMIGQSRQIVHRGPWNEKNPENYLVEIQIPLENVN